jgi:DNA-binding MarR family transcriptional regulator
LKKDYFKLAVKSERLHRLFLEVVNTELRRLHIRDINSVQAVILYNVGVGDQPLNINDFYQRGYYLGSNVSYNLRKLVRNDYLHQYQNPNDLRSNFLKLSKKGVKLCELLDEMFNSQSVELKKHGVDSVDLNKLYESLNGIESFLKEIKNG